MCANVYVSASLCFLVHFVWHFSFLVTCLLWPIQVCSYFIFIPFFSLLDTYLFSNEREQKRVWTWFGWVGRRGRSYGELEEENPNQNILNENNLFSIKKIFNIVTVATFRNFWSEKKNLVFPNRLYIERIEEYSFFNWKHKSITSKTMFLTVHLCFNYPETYISLQPSFHFITHFNVFYYFYFFLYLLTITILCC